MSGDRSDERERKLMAWKVLGHRHREARRHASLFPEHPRRVHFSPAQHLRFIRLRALYPQSISSTMEMDYTS